MEKVMVKEFLESIKVKDVKKEEEERLVFVDLDSSMFKNNSYILDKYFKNEFGKRCCFANLLQLKGEVSSMYELHKILKKDFGCKVSLAGYKYNPEHYKFSCILDQVDYEENLYREKSEEDEMLENEAKRKEARIPLDFKALEMLSNVFFKALRSRLVILLNLDSVPAIINNAYDCYYKDVSCSIVNATINSKLNELRRLLEDEEVTKYVKDHNDCDIFDASDIISTYQKCLRLVSGIRQESLEEFRDIIHNDLDKYEELILSNDNYIIEEPIFGNEYTEEDMDD